MEDQKYSFQDFIGIIKRLRADDGCPWDREQTHQSLKKCLTEECNEVLEGIEIYESTGDWAIFVKNWEMYFSRWSCTV